MKTCHDLEQLVFDFNLDIGVNRLGGIFGCFEFFSDQQSLLSSFDDIVSSYRKIAEKYSDDQDAHDIYLAGLKQDYALKIGKKKTEVLFCYLGFMTQVIAGLYDAPEFAKWVIDSKFDAQPHIFTKMILLRGLKLSIELGNDRVASIVSSAAHAKKSGCLGVVLILISLSAMLIAVGLA